MPDATITSVSAGADIVVVGGGIVGCAIAYELARRGASVTVLEERQVGRGATHASGGMLAPYIEAGDAGPLHELSLRSLALFDGFVAHVEADSGLGVSYRRTGTLQVACSAAGLQGLRTAAARLAADGVEATLLDAAAVRSEEPQLGRQVVGGLLVPEHGFVAAEMLTAALAAAARHRGARIVEGCTAQRIATRAGGLVVETENGPIGGGTVVLAAGSWSGQIDIAGLSGRIPIRPVRGQLLRLAWHGPRLRRITWGERCYLVPWDDGTLLVGATVEEVGFDEQTTAPGVRELLSAVCDLLPAAADAGFIDARAGLRPATTDLLPVIGRSAACPDLMYATGHYRSGVLLAPVTATLVADALLDGRTDPLLSATSPQRFGAL
jgi:glycine oxidase